MHTKPVRIRFATPAVHNPFDELTDLRPRFGSFTLIRDDYERTVTIERVMDENTPMQTTVTLGPCSAEELAALEQILKEAPLLWEKQQMEQFTKKTTPNRGAVIAVENSLPIDTP